MNDDLHSSASRSNLNRQIQKYPRKGTRIFEIEFTSRCNLACHYCPHGVKDLMTRPKMDMPDDVFDRVLIWLKYYSDQGTQGEISLQGLGESTLHPKFIEMIIKVRGVIPNNSILVSTNGLLLNEDMCRAAKAYGIRIDISLHRPEKAAQAYFLAEKFGVLGVAGIPAVTTPVNWAGQLDWIQGVKPYPCPWLHQGGLYMLSNGNIATCGFDVDEASVVGDIWTDPKVGVEVKPWRCCATCHQIP